MNILITGGASGLGEAITRKLAAGTDNKIWFTYNKSRHKAEKISAEHKNTTAIKCDFAIENELQELLVKVQNLNIDVLINNAYSGLFLNQHFNKTSTGDFEADFRSNIIPVIELTKTAITIFRKKKSGKIITILSAALVNTPPIGSGVYVAGKAYLAQLSKVWAVENAKFNISSNTISPSFMETNLTSTIDERLVEQMKDNHPLKKLLSLSEVADSVAFLVNSSAHINGADIVINAGTAIK